MLIEDAFALLSLQYSVHGVEVPRAHSRSQILRNIALSSLMLRQLFDSMRKQGQKAPSTSRGQQRNVSVPKTLSSRGPAHRRRSVVGGNTETS